MACVLETVEPVDTWAAKWPPLHEIVAISRVGVAGLIIMVVTVAGVRTTVVIAGTGLRSCEDA